MRNYLIFRTDKIGDFLLTAILIKNIKRNDKDSFVTIICSKKNYDYIKTFENVDKVILYKKNILNFFFLILKLIKIKFNFSIIHDEKNRSKLINYFIRKDKSLVIKSNISQTKISIIKTIINKLSFNYSTDDLNILQNRSFNSHKRPEEYLLLHYDEKWSNLTYIKEYKNIEPNKKEFIKFLKKLIEITKLKIIISTGTNTPKFLKDFIFNNSFDDIKIFENQSFKEIEELVINSKILISCHGAISHIAAAKSIKQIDIIDFNLNNPYSNWTAHFRNYNCVYRKKFVELSIDILKLL